MNGRKASLTPDEVLRVAYAHIIHGVDQHVLASLMAVYPGRTAVACKVIEWAMNNHMALYKHIREIEPAAVEDDAVLKLIEAHDAR
jgi:hypothetical protein